MGLPRQHAFETVQDNMLNYRKERDIDLKPCVSETTWMLYLY